MRIFLKLKTSWYRRNCQIFQPRMPSDSERDVPPVFIVPRRQIAVDDRPSRTGALVCAGLVRSYRGLARRTQLGLESLNPMKLRVVVADDNGSFLRELTSLLQTEFDVVGTAADGKSALECIRSCRPDVAVLDLEMPRPNGIEVTKELKKDHLGLAVVICSVEDDPEIIEAALQAGALGYVIKLRFAKDLIAAVKSTVRGESFVSLR